MQRLVVLALCLVSLTGCYYMQAAKGQLELTRKRQPIDEVLQRDDTSEELAARLRLVQEARQFAIDELHLPDNDTYRTYADVEREYVVWNVFAAPEFSLQPRTWCFPVAGCVSYRGYFRREAAMREAERLREQGFDVAVGGVSAYSTLGKLKDPVLNTMMKWDDIELVALLFHELAHQVLYVKGDSSFNESFATAVEEAGVERWLAARGMQDEFAEYRQRGEFSQRVLEVVVAARDELEALYEQPLGDEEKRRRKQERLRYLQVEVGRLLEREGREPSAWLSGELNNARLIPMMLYEGRVPEFRAMLADCEQDLRCFYARAKESAGR